MVFMYFNLKKEKEKEKEKSFIVLLKEFTLQKQ